MFSHIDSIYGSLVFRTTFSNITMEACSFFTCTSQTTGGFHVFDSQYFEGKNLVFQYCSGNSANNFVISSSESQSTSMLKDVNFMRHSQNGNIALIRGPKSCQISNQNSSLQTTSDNTIPFLFALNNITDFVLSNSYITGINSLSLQQVNNAIIQNVYFYGYLRYDVIDSNVLFRNCQLKIIDSSEAISEFYENSSKVTFTDCTFDQNFSFLHTDNVIIESEIYSSIPAQTVQFYFPYASRMLSANSTQNRQIITTQTLSSTTFQNIIITECFFLNTSQTLTSESGAIWISYAALLSIDTCTFSNCYSETVGTISATTDSYSITKTCFLQNNGAVVSQYEINTTIGEEKTNKELVTSISSILAPNYQSFRTVWAASTLTDSVNFSHCLSTGFTNSIHIPNSGNIIPSSIKNSIFIDCSGGYLIVLNEPNFSFNNTIFQNSHFSSTMIVYPTEIHIDHCSFFNIQVPKLISDKSGSQTAKLSNCIGDENAHKALPEITIAQSPYPLYINFQCLTESDLEDSNLVAVIVGCCIAGLILIGAITGVVICCRMHKKIKEDEERRKIESAVLSDFG